MKKSLIAALLLIMILFAVACSDGSGSNDANITADPGSNSQDESALQNRHADEPLADLVMSPSNSTDGFAERWREWVSDGIHSSVQSAAAFAAG